MVTEQMTMSSDDRNDISVDVPARDAYKADIAKTGTCGEALWDRLQNSWVYKVVESITCRIMDLVKRMSKKYLFVHFVLEYFVPLACSFIFAFDMVSDIRVAAAFFDCTVCGGEKCNDDQGKRCKVFAWITAFFIAAPVLVIAWRLTCARQNEYNKIQSKLLLKAARDKKKVTEMRERTSDFLKNCWYPFLLRLPLPALWSKLEFTDKQSGDNEDFLSGQMRHMNFKAGFCVPVAFVSMIPVAIALDLGHVFVAVLPMLIPFMGVEHIMTPFLALRTLCRTYCYSPDEHGPRGPLGTPKKDQIS